MAASRDQYLKVPWKSSTEFLGWIRSQARILRLRHLVTLAELSLFAVWFAVLRPAALGGPASYVIVSGISMQPTLKTGDLVVAQRQPSYAAGDIVAFRVPRGEAGEGAMIIHRVIGMAGSGYIVQGDNKRFQDPWEPTAEDILGRLWLLVPVGGRILGFFRQPSFLGAVAGIWGMAFVLSYGKGNKTRSEKQNAPRRHGGGPSQPRSPGRPQPLTTRRAGAGSLSRAASEGVEQGVVDSRAVPPATRTGTATERASFLALSASSRTGRRVLIKQALPPNAIVHVQDLKGVMRFYVQTRAGSQIHDVANG
jgi:signal peptidase